MKKQITNKQRKELLKNKNIFGIDKNTIIFTEEFKEHFVKEKYLGLSAEEIFRNALFDISIIGKSRLHYYVVEWRKQLKVVESNNKLKVERIKENKFKKDESGNIKMDYGKSNYSSFTNEQVIEFNSNENVIFASNDSITYTAEFKNKVVKEHKEGKSYKQIFIECGFDPEIIGRHRIKSNSIRWMKQYQKNGPFTKQDNLTPIIRKEIPTRRKEIDKLKVKIRKLEIENEFLKKVQSLKGV